jgi:hypothetical protein
MTRPGRPQVPQIMPVEARHPGDPAAFLKGGMLAALWPCDDGQPDWLFREFCGYAG